MRELQNRCWAVTPSRVGSIPTPLRHLDVQKGFFGVLSLLQLLPALLGCSARRSLRRLCSFEGGDPLHQRWMRVVQ